MAESTLDQEPGNLDFIHTLLSTISLTFNKLPNISGYKSIK